MSRRNSAVIVHYVQKSIADGRADDNGQFVFSRREILENTNISPSTFDRCIDEAMEIISTGYDFCLNFHIPDYKINQENVFIDVHYEKGKLIFKRNPMTQSEEFAYMWDELRPNHPFFTYIYSTTYTDRKGQNNIT